MIHRRKDENGFAEPFDDLIAIIIVLMGTMICLGATFSFFSNFNDRHRIQDPDEIIWETLKLIRADPSLCLTPYGKAKVGCFSEKKLLDFFEVSSEESRQDGVYHLDGDTEIDEKIRNIVNLDEKYDIYIVIKDKFPIASDDLNEDRLVIDYNINIIDRNIEESSYYQVLSKVAPITIDADDYLHPGEITIGLGWNSR